MTGVHQELQILARPRVLCYRTRAMEYLPAATLNSKTSRQDRARCQPSFALWVTGCLAALVAGCGGNETGEAPVSRCYPENACSDEMFRSGIRASLGDAKAGSATFSANCTRCHGADGAGIGDARHIDMGSPAWQASMRDSGIVATVRAGRGASMPAFAFKEQELRDLLAYTRSLVRTPGTQAPGAVAPAEPDSDRGGY